MRMVLEQMQMAERELPRLDAALNRVEPGTMVPILRSLRLNSLAQVDNLETLKRVVHGVERALKAPTEPNPEPRLEAAATLCLSMT